MGLVNFNLRHAELIFGLDIGQTSLKVMQLEQQPGKKPRVTGYGVSNFYSDKAIKDGEIVDQKALAGALKQLLQEKLTGSITAKRAACTLPTSHTFSRPMKLPKMAKDHLDEAVQLEAEQYIPLPPDKLYIDYEISRQDEQNMELLLVAAPKTVVDSYMKFLDAVGLQPVALEPSMNATARLFNFSESAASQPAILVDFGSVAIDIAVLDKTMFVNSTVTGGSDTVTSLIAKEMGVSRAEAYDLKNKSGLAYSDNLRDIVPAIKPLLDNLVKEIRRIMRYYDERTGRAKPIGQVITTGGGATIKGLNEYLSNELKIPCKVLDPWSKFDFGKLTPPDEMAKSMYATVAGEAMLTGKELYSD